MKFSFLILLAGFMAACNQIDPTATLIPTEVAGFEVFVPVVSVLTATPFQPSQDETESGYPPPGGAPGPQGGVGAPITGAGDSLNLWIPPNLPPSIREALALPDILTLATGPENASLRLAVGDSAVISQAVYALVAPFPTLEDGVEVLEARRAWRGNGEGHFAGEPLLVDQATLETFTSWWGSPAEGAVRVIDTEKLLDQAWESRPAWALVPFDDLDPRWKVLEVGAASPLHKEFDLEAYPLAVPLSLEGDDALVNSLMALHGPDSEAPILPPAANRDPDKLTTVVLTGVTALVRATAWTMERQGNLHPAVDIGPWLRQADILHISNEVPFAANCPYPNPSQEGLRFCSNPKYIELMEDIGTDVVELTGDHFQDWGTDAMFLTLEMYQERGWPYYGGGENRQDARKAVTLEHNGNKVAFIGCNRKGGGYAGASESSPGAVSCDYDWIYSEIARLKEEGYLPIATFQHFEYYTYQAQPDQIADAQGMAGAGAEIVSGSQAHHPQALEFIGDAFVHHGLGNLFFDQLTVVPNGDIAFIDRHVIYDGEHISTELLTIQFVDFARARPMTEAERRELLRNTFNASGW